MARRVVVQSEAGQRLSVDEDRFDDPQANPLNRARDEVSFDRDTDTTTIRRLPARPLDDHISLKQEGFRIVGRIHGDAHDEDCPVGCAMHPGNEIRLEDG